MELWNQTCGVPLTTQSFTSFSYVANFSNSFSFSVFICKNSWVIPPFQDDVTSCSYHAFKVSGFPRHLLSLSSSLFPITFCSRPCLHQLGGLPTNTVLHKLTCVCMHKCTFNTHTDVILSAQSKQFRITALQSQISSLHSTSFPAPSPGKKNPQRMDRKRK